MNETHAHPDQPELQAQVIAASTTPNSPPLYTVRVRVPRIIWAEIMTHRALSRNARSSRAVPVHKVIAEVIDRPFVPWHWTGNKPGMQGTPDYDKEVRNPMWHHTDLRENVWESAMHQAVRHAKAFADAGYHKQVCNRLLEPFMWIDALITATDWANFFWLRDHEDAEPHLRDAARLIKQAMDAAEPEHLQPGEWHLPYVTKAEREDHELDLLLRMATERAARISYEPFDADKVKTGPSLYEKLISGDRLHASPFEHQATPDTYDGEWQNPHLHGNLRGWIQHRKTIPGENHDG